MTESTQIIGSAYLATLQGICKIIEMVSSSIAALLVGIGFYGGVIDIFEVAACISLIVSLFFLIIYVSGMVEKITLSWNRIQFFFHIVWAIFYLAVVILVFERGNNYIRVIVGGVFGLIALIAHVIDAYDNYKKQPLF